MEFWHSLFVNSIPCNIYCINYYHSVPTDLPEFTVPNMDKVEPDKLRDSISQFKPWISSTAWYYWEEFLHTTYPTLSLPSPLMTKVSLVGHLLHLKRRLADECMWCPQMIMRTTLKLEQMLDEERVAVEVHILAYTYVHSIIAIS